MNSKLLLLSAILLGNIAMYSQTNQSLRASAGIGMVSFSYNLAGGSSKPKLGYGGSFNYSYFFSPNWGIGVGVGASMLTTDGFLDGAKVSFENKIDDEGDLFRKDVYFRDWHEIQKALLVEVPIQLHYEYDFGFKKRRKLYIDLGVKVKLPLMASYVVTKGELEIQGYYPEWNVLLYGMPNHGLGRENIGNTSGPLSLPLNIAATVGVGFSFEVSKKIDVYVGGVFDYGFTSMKGANDGDLLYEDGNSTLKYRGILLSSAVDKVNQISLQGEVGVRIAIGNSWKKGIYRL